MSDDRVFALADRRFPSLEALHAWFNAQIAGTKDHGERFDLRLADRLATARHIERAKAAANAPVPAPPAPKPPPEPLPPEATDDQKAEWLYGTSLQVTERAPLRVGESHASVAHEADDQAALELYGSSVVGVGFGPVRPKPAEEAEEKKANLPADAKESKQ